MFVCVCFGVPESEVERAIESGATTREAVTRACGAGGDCGACHGMIAEMIEDHLDGGAAPKAAVGCPCAAADRLVPGAALLRTRAA